MICSIYRPKRKKGGKVVTSRMWRGRIRLSPLGKLHDIPLHTTDKQVALANVRAAALQLQQEQAGIIPPKLLRESAARPLAEHLENFMASRETSGRCTKYIRAQREQLLRLFAGCRWRLPVEVTHDSFETWRPTAAVIIAWVAGR